MMDERGGLLEHYLNGQELIIWNDTDMNGCPVVYQPRSGEDAMPWRACEVPGYHDCSGGRFTRRYSHHEVSVSPRRYPVARP
jgi:hypothetical protein